MRSLIPVLTAFAVATGGVGIAGAQSDGRCDGPTKVGCNNKTCITVNGVPHCTPDD